MGFNSGFKGLIYRTRKLLRQLLPSDWTTCPAQLGLLCFNPVKVLNYFIVPFILKLLPRSLTLKLSAIVLMFKIFGLEVCLQSSSRHLLTIRRVTLMLFVKLFEFSTDTLSPMPELPTPLCPLHYHQMQLALNVSLFFNVISASMFLYTIYGSTGCFSPLPNTLRLQQKRR